jgi:AcrR family transcriptional regulator
MARKLSSEKRANILRTALRLFVANGVKNTSTAEIAQVAGIAAGTLFLYFPTKQDLLDEIAIELSKEQVAKINRLLKPSLSARETFFLIWSGTVAWFLENMDAYQYIQQARNTGLISERAIK